MKTIKIKYVDFWAGFNPEDDDIFRTLTKHFNVVFSDSPDYIFYSCFGHEHLKYSDCIKICFLGENLAPDFNLCDYAIAFEELSFGDRYFQQFASPDLLASPELYSRSDRSANKEHRPHFCSYVYSNGSADPFREKLFKAICNYKPVLCGGSLHHNIDIPHIAGNDFRTDRIAFEKDFKFSIACENSSHPGYCTEKIFVSLTAGTIPIYWGDPSVTKIYNKKAFINVFDYPNLDAVVNEIRKIDTTPELYETMIREPIFAPEWSPANYSERFDNFLRHIFDQPKEVAFRRNRVLWGTRYDETMNEWYNAWTEKQALPKRNFWSRFLNTK